MLLLLILSALSTTAFGCIPMKPTDPGIPAISGCPSGQFGQYDIAMCEAAMAQIDASAKCSMAMISSTAVTCGPNMRVALTGPKYIAGGNEPVVPPSISCDKATKMWMINPPNSPSFPLSFSPLNASGSSAHLARTRRMSKTKSDPWKSAQQDVQGDNLNDFVAALSAGGKLKQHAEHDNVRRPERQINKFTKFTDKNRFNNAVLFSQGSIDLQQEEKTDTTYIHASKIPCPGGALILSQAPMKNTIVDFYRLIWQQKVNTIVTLVNLDNKDDCFPYFERKAGKKTTQRGRYRVRTVAVRAEGKSIINYELKIENYLEKKENKSRVLNIISVLGWEPDQVFDMKVIVAAIHSADALKRIGPQENGKDAPMLIHGCSGIRRTGVFALAYIFSKQILGPREINLVGVIEQVRMVRYGVLRKKAMFFFLLEIVIALIAETGLVKPGSEDHLQAIAQVKKAYATIDVKGPRKKKTGKTNEKADKSEAKTNYDDDDEEEGHGDEYDDKSVTGIVDKTDKTDTKKDGRSKGRKK